MRFSQIVGIVFVVAVALLAYREGYLGKIHPLLAPKGEKIDPEVGVSPVVEDEEKAPEEPKVTATVPSDNSKASDKEVVKKSKSENQDLDKERRAEAARIEKEAKDAERAKVAQEKKDAEEARIAFNEALTKEIAAMNEKASDLREKIKEARAKLNTQEFEWRQEKIKTRDADKQALRDSVAVYTENLQKEIDAIRTQVSDKLRQYK